MSNIKRHFWDELMERQEKEEQWPEQKREQEKQKKPSSNDMEQISSQESEK